MKISGLIELGLVTVARAYSDGRQYIEVRGLESDSLYGSERNRWDRQWEIGDEVSIYCAKQMSERARAAAGYQNAVALCYLPPGEGPEDQLDNTAQAPHNAFRRE